MHLFNICYSNCLEELSQQTGLTMLEGKEGSKVGNPPAEEDDSLNTVLVLMSTCRKAKIR